MSARTRSRIQAFGLFKAWVAIALGAALTSACATKPTRVQENVARRLEVTQEAGLKPVAITESTVVLDARPAFDYTMAHIPRSHNVRWDEFSQAEETAKGNLQSDLFAIARRLARLGVSPDSHVVVVGNGVRGAGEEGRVAWMLAYLGVRNVQFTDLNAIKGPLTNQTTTGFKSAPIWKPVPAERMLVTKAELLHVINKGGVYKSTSFRGGPDKMYKILDVRTSREYLGKEGLGLRKRIPNMDAVNISWTEFLNRDGRPNPAISEQLKSVGITPEQRIIVLSNHGVRSGAVTMALLSLGYADTGNFAGGLEDLLAGF